MDNEKFFNGVEEWDFEKYASVIFYLFTYYEKCMNENEKAYALDTQNEYSRVPVSPELLEKLGLDETLEEFYGEAQVMQEEMCMDDETPPLLKVEKEQAGLMLYIDPILLKSMAELPDLDDGDTLEDEDIN